MSIQTYPRTTCVAVKSGGFTKMEDELIKYILELVGEHDVLCEELHKNSNEADYCSKHCNSLNENCVRRLMYHRTFNQDTCMKEHKASIDATCRTCVHRLRFALNDHSAKIIQCCELQPSKRSNSGYKTIKVTNSACIGYEKE